MSAPKAFTIHSARTQDDMKVSAALFKAYAESIGIDLSYQSFDSELASLPGQYAPPRGELLLARDGNNVAIGCVAIRPQSQPYCCEMKRLYVGPDGRGLGIGKALMDRVIQMAREMHYRQMRLDTLSTMTAAISMYKKAGFAETEAYYETPIGNTIFFAMALE